MIMRRIIFIVVGIISAFFAVYFFACSPGDVLKVF
jgi:hypothetical protein